MIQIQRSKKKSQWIQNNAERLLKTTSLTKLFQLIREKSTIRYHDERNNPTYAEDQIEHIVDYLFTKHHLPRFHRDEQHNLQLQHVHTEFTLPDTLNRLREHRFAQGEIDPKKLLSKFNYTKAGGPDGFHGESLSRTLVGRQWLNYTCSQLNKGDMEARLVPIEKKEKGKWVPISRSTNMRPLSLQNTCVKLFQTAARPKLTQAIRTTPGMDYQRGFKEASSTLPCIRKLKDWMSRERRHPTGKAVLLLDIKSAFSTISWEAVAKFLDYQMSPEEAQLFKNFTQYQDIRFGNKRYYPSAGTPQGSTISPELFLGGLHMVLMENPYFAQKIREGLLIAYADDIALMFDPLTETKLLQQAIDSLKQYNLVFNYKKSIVLELFENQIPRDAAAYKRRVRPSFAVDPDADPAEAEAPLSRRSSRDIAYSLVEFLRRYDPRAAPDVEIEQSDKPKPEEVLYLGAPLMSTMSNFINVKMRRTIGRLKAIASTPETLMQAIQRTVLAKANYYQNDPAEDNLLNVEILLNKFRAVQQELANSSLGLSPGANLTALIANA